ncbi:MAG: hypothetical protein U0703_28575 [Anaerolineae bacterium]
MARKVQIPFVVSYPADAVVVPAEAAACSTPVTDSEGELLFITDTNTPVITDGNPTGDIELVLVRVGS